MVFADFGICGVVGLCLCVVFVRFSVCCCCGRLLFPRFWLFGLDLC